MTLVEESLHWYHTSNPGETKKNDAKLTRGKGWGIGTNTMWRTRRSSKGLGFGSGDERIDRKYGEDPFANAEAKEGGILTKVHQLWTSGKMMTETRRAISSLP